MTDKTDLHLKEIRSAIERAIAVGLSSYEEILNALGGADPLLVKEICDTIGISSQEKHILKNRDIKKINLNKAIARRRCAALPLILPAPDPMLSQWWFTLDTICSLSEHVWKLAENSPAVFLGTPTVGYHYAYCYNQESLILDVDPQLIKSLELPASATKDCYDVYDELPEKLSGKYSFVLIDPPWYKPDVNLFIGRARQFLNDEGFILCVLPSRLTRPDVIYERTELIKQLLESKFEIVALNSDYVQYTVPKFESQAFKSLPEFSGRWWRRGDLLILRVVKESSFEIPNLEKKKFQIYTRNPIKSRFFIYENKSDPNLSNIIEPVDGFDKSISTRQFSIEDIMLWGTNKKGVKIKDADICKRILSLWAEGKTKEETISSLKGIKNMDPNFVVSLFEKHLGLWEDDEIIIRRRSTRKLEENRSISISDLASEPTGRIYPFQQDGFRIDFQRDRDRILWSHSLKRLANKTQLYPVNSDDELRRRLTHTIEVMQIASTIATAFGLDNYLTEAGALAHDLGHTPFGHAGEYALNKLLNNIDERLGGFNHYEHGVDVVRWLEDVYQSPGAEGFPGLNLTFQTVECIFKHTYYRNNESPFAQRTLSKKTKHKDLHFNFKKDPSCHLEGQAVRIADKISYLISDLEDGIRRNIISLKNLVNCKFFEHAPIDIIPSEGESLYKRFISQRRAILKVIMEDILTATDRRLANFSSLEEIRNEDSYIVSYSESLNRDIHEIWEKLQAGILHKDRLVMAESARAAKVVTDLLLLYTIAPHFVDTPFREAHSKLNNTEYMQWYRNQVGEKIAISKSLFKFAYEHVIGMDLISQEEKWLIPTENLILAKDYVASLTDTRASLEHRKYCGIQ